MKEANRIRDLAKFDLCEEFADSYNLPVDYVWLEFIDPNFSEFEDVKFILESYPQIH